jgi:putative membrane protein
MSIKNIQRVAILDALYGISALGIFILGLILWFGIGKPSSFFNTNMFFHIKLTLFFILGLLSIYPTIFFIKNRKKDDDVIEVPKLVITIIKIELFIFALIPLFAVLMASGYGI